MTDSIAKLRLVAVATPVAAITPPASVAGGEAADMLIRDIALSTGEVD